MTKDERIQKINELLLKNISEEDRRTLQTYLSMRNQDGSIKSYAGKDILIDKIIQKYEKI